MAFVWIKSDKRNERSVSVCASGATKNITTVTLRINMISNILHAIAWPTKKKKRSRTTREIEHEKDVKNGIKPKQCVFAVIQSLVEEQWLCGQSPDWHKSDMNVGLTRQKNRNEKKQQQQTKLRKVHNNPYCVSISRNWKLLIVFLQKKKLYIIYHRIHQNY